MEGREERRDRTVRYGERTRKVHLRAIHPSGVVDCICERSAWFFAKGKSVGCRCRKRQRSLGPKVPGSLCHGWGGDYHPAVRERIEGKRLCRAFLRALDAIDCSE